MKLYGLNSCDSCRAARKAFKNITIEYVDVRESGVPKNVLKMALEIFGAGFDQQIFHYMAWFGRASARHRFVGIVASASHFDEAALNREWV